MKNLHIQIQGVQLKKCVSGVMDYPPCHLFFTAHCIFDHVGTWSSGLLIFPHAQWAYLCSEGLFRGFLYLDSHQRILSELGRHRHAPKQRTSHVARKTEHISGPRHSILHPQLRLCSELWVVWFVHQRRASTLEKEQGYHSLFHHLSLSFWIIKSLERLIRIPLPVEMYPHRTSKLTCRLPRVGLWPHLSAGFSTQLREPCGLELLWGINWT